MGKQYQAGDVMSDFSFATPWKGQKNFYNVSKGKKKVIFFLRYYGCRVCQLEFRHIVREYGKFEEKGAQVYVALQSSVETIRSQIEEKDIAFEIICDPQQTLYHLFNIGSFDPGKPRSKRLEEKIAEAAASGIVHGSYEGNEQQLPAVFVVDENQKVNFAHYASDIADIPDHDELLRYL